MLWRDTEACFYLVWQHTMEMHQVELIWKGTHNRSTLNLVSVDCCFRSFGYVKLLTFSVLERPLRYNVKKIITEKSVSFPLKHENEYKIMWKSSQNDMKMIMK